MPAFASSRSARAGRSARELANVPKALFVQALGDANPRVQLQAITGLKRLGAVDAAGAMLPLTASADLVVPHVAIDALVSLGASDAALACADRRRHTSRGGGWRAARAAADPHLADGHRAHRRRSPRRATPRCAPASCRRSRACTTATASGAARWRSGGAPGPTPPVPYYDPVAWDESARILSVLRAAVVTSTTVPAPAAADVTRLMQDLERNRVLPPGGGDVLASVKLAGDPGAARGRRRAARFAAPRSRRAARQALRSARPSGSGVPRSHRQDAGHRNRHARSPATSCARPPSTAASMRRRARRRLADWRRPPGPARSSARSTASPASTSRRLGSPRRSTAPGGSSSARVPTRRTSPRFAI